MLKELPSFPQLAKSSVEESTKKSKRVRRSTLSEKNDGPPKKCLKVSCDLLYSTKTKGSGWPKNIRPQRKKPVLPRQISEGTRKLRRKDVKELDLHPAMKIWLVDFSCQITFSLFTHKQDNKENQCANLSSASQGTKVASHVKHNEWSVNCSYFIFSGRELPKRHHQVDPSILQMNLRQLLVITIHSLYFDFTSFLFLSEKEEETL